MDAKLFLNKGRDFVALPIEVFVSFVWIYPAQALSIRGRGRGRNKR